MLIFCELLSFHVFSVFILEAEKFRGFSGYIYRNCTEDGWSDLNLSYEEACAFNDYEEMEPEVKKKCAVFSFNINDSMKKIYQHKHHFCCLSKSLPSFSHADCIQMLPPSLSETSITSLSFSMISPVMTQKG